MKKVWSQYQLHKEKILLSLGFLVVAVLMLPYVLLGQGSYVQVHDQVDGEILNYIYQAKYLFKGNIVPEFMNGMSKAAMTPPAPFGVLFYVVLPPYVAFVVMQGFVMLVGFWGMYCLCKKMGMLEEIAFVTAVLFASMPFYPTYGLAALGQPLLILCFAELIRGMKKPLPFLGILLYAGFSSLTLVGYIWVCLGVLVGLGLILKKQPAKCFWAGWFVLVLTYVLTNLELFASLLGNGFTTHREEMVLTATADLWEKFKELFFVGGSYSNVYSVAIFAVTLAVLVIGGACVAKNCRCKDVTGAEIAALRTSLREMIMLLVLIIILTLCAVLWNSQGIVELRKSLGGIFAYFQADRVYWTFPFLWMMLLAVVLQVLFLLGKGKNVVKRTILFTTCFVLLALEGYQILRDSNFNKNIRLLLIEDYEQVTWESIYMEEVFEDIDELLDKDKENYSVVSLGIYPSVALYNGYTCADGYSNNYDLDYKHAFRRIQAAELEKNDEVRKYIDEWGNRLYLVDAKSGINGMVGKNQGLAYEGLSYDTEAMRDLNIKYVFAAAPITDASDMGWDVIEGSPFQSENSYYAIWVYDIGE